MTNRERILTVIRNAGGWITSECICRDVGISRTAVSKQVAVLNALGYEIESAHRKGYRFGSAPDLLLPEEIRYGLKTSTFGKHLIQYAEEVESTNLKAKEAALQGEPEGAIFLTERQTAGRGRRGRSWFSGEHTAIAMSLLLRPSFVPQQLTLLPLLTAVVVQEAIEEVTGIRSEVKWPNDLLVGGKKLCGILTEAAFDMERIDYVVIGIGINVNVAESQIPEELRDIATSLRCIDGHEHSRADLVRAVLTGFERQYTAAGYYGFDDVLVRWKACSHTLGRHVTVRGEREEHSGIAEGLTPAGGLLLRDETGMLKAILSGDVIVRHK